MDYQIPKRKDWREGDIFAIQITDSEFIEYNERYLLFIYIGQDEKPKRPIFRVKITKDKKLPSTKEEIEKLDYIIMFVWVIEQALHYNDEKHNELVKKLQDKYGYLYSYQLIIWTSFKKKIPDDIKYIGNYKLSAPINEYIPSIMNIHLYSWEDITQKMISNYKRYNLNGGEDRFSPEICNKWHAQEKFIYELVRGVLEGTIEVPKNEKIIKHDTLTYVGGDKNHPDYKD